MSQVARFKAAKQRQPKASAKVDFQRELVRCVEEHRRESELAYAEFYDRIQRENRAIADARAHGLH